jgi:hypothetical protein
LACAGERHGLPADVAVSPLGAATSDVRRCDRDMNQLNRFQPGQALLTGRVSGVRLGRPDGRLVGRWAGSLGLPAHLPTLTGPCVLVSGEMYLRG